MLIALLSLVLQAEAPAVRVLARGADGFGEAAVVTPQRPWPVPIPLVTRSEVVQRVVPGPDGLALRLEGLDDPAAVTVEAVAHPLDHQVLVVGGEPVMVGPPTLPRRVTRASSPASRGLPPVDALAATARRDGAGVPAGDLQIELGGDLEPGVRLFVVTTTGLALAARSPGEVLAQAEGLLVDQVFLASSAPVASARALPFRDIAREGILELVGPVPEDGADALTLLVRVSLANARGIVAPAESGAAPGFLVDRAEELGVSAFHLEGPDEQLDIRPTMGPGVAWGDVDDDGKVDLYVVQGAGRPESEPLKNQLFLNQGNAFVEVPDAAGAGDDGAGMGALFFDGDGDGRLDLYVANYGADVLYEQRLERSESFIEHGFHDVSAVAGVGGDRWSAGVAASDYDRDGDLDLYVTSYLVYDLALMPPRGELAYQREDPIEMLPFAFPGQANTFLRNESDARGMRFVDVTEELGVGDAEGRGMQPVFLDFDRDGDDDLYVANDVSYNKMYRNEGDGTFQDVSFSTGLDDPRGGMGLATGDVDLDGDEDVFLTNWELEPNALYVNNLLRHDSQRHHVASFRDMIVRAGLGPAGIGATSWGAELFDAENDGDLDLFVANGYTSPDYESTGICVGQPNHLFENDGTGRFADASAKAGAALARRLPSRAAVGCDFDLDGDVDLAVTANNGPLQLLQNELPADAKGRWLLVRLRGANGNTRGIGAEVTVTAGGRIWRRQLRAGTSYLGGNPPELHFGLGEADAVSVEVRWPSGRTTVHPMEGVDRVVTLAE